MSQYEFDPNETIVLLPVGEYDAVILKAEAGETRAGDSKIAIMAQVYGRDGDKVTVHDHITTPWGLRRLRQLCEVCGQDFEAGSVDPSEFVGKNVRVSLGVRTDRSGEFEDQNVIRKYMKDNSAPASQPTSTPQRPTQTQTAKEAIGEREAFEAYCEKIRADRPNVEDSYLRENWNRTRKDFFEDKPVTQYTVTDWLKMRDDGPGEFIPF